VVELVIEVSNLKKTYGEIKALKGISFEVKRREVFTFIGPNGAGKTTTLEIIEGLRKKDSRIALLASFIFRWAEER